MEGQRATDIDGLYNGMGTGESRKMSSMPSPAMTACQQVAWTVGWATGTKANICGGQSCSSLSASDMYSTDNAWCNLRRFEQVCL